MTSLRTIIWTLILSTVTFAGDKQFKLIYDSDFEARIASQIEIQDGGAMDIDVRGTLYIVDSGRHQLLQLGPDAKEVIAVGGFGQSQEEFDNPRDVATTTLDVFIADYNNNRISRFDKNLNALSELRSNQAPPFDFERVLSLAVSSQLDLFILEDGSKKIVKFDRFSSPSVTFGGIYETYGQLLDPRQLELDNKSRLFVTDPAQSAVIVFDYLGNYLKTIEHPLFKQPTALHWGMEKRLFVVDSESANIFLFDERLSFMQTFTVSATDQSLVDVASWRDPSTDTLHLFVLMSESCRRYELVSGGAKKTP
ncbi:MAG: NHL repeat-containing protein [Calditrichia bacterium]